MSQPKRIYLSPPHLGAKEMELVLDAFQSNWVAPLGPHVDAFEREFAEFVGARHAAALSSGTAALHLGLKLLGVRPGDEVLCPTLTFAASANPILYEDARPVFIDSEATSWNMDPLLLAEELRESARRNRLPKAVISVDLYGQCASYRDISPLCAQFGVPLLEDAAEALGARYLGQAAGRFGDLAAFSFNGNKIITTSGGGMLVGEDETLIEQARFLASQARDPAPHYQHSQIGYNYRLSNVLAAIGRGQLQVLPERIAQRRRVREYYQAALGGMPGLSFAPQSPACEPNYWLTCITLEPALFGASSSDLRISLEQAGIEARPVWKPLHLQPAFAGCRVRGGAVAERAFSSGLCLPSGSNLSGSDLERICEVVHRVHHRQRCHQVI